MKLHFQAGLFGLVFPEVVFLHILKYLRQLKEEEVPMLTLNVLLMITSGTAAYFDLKKGRIPNVLILSASLTALCLRTALRGPAGIPVFLAGAAVPALVLFPLFRFRMMGAGDIKLLMCLGGMVGFPEIINLLVWSVVTAGVLSVLQMTFVTGCAERFRYFLQYVTWIIRSGQIRPYRLPGKRPENIPFALPVFAAVIIYLLVKVQGRIV